jgi:hypothetical protein
MKFLAEVISPVFVGIAVVACCQGKSHYEMAVITAFILSTYATGIFSGQFYAYERKFP